MLAWLRFTNMYSYTLNMYTELIIDTNNAGMTTFYKRVLL